MRAFTSRMSQAVRRERRQRTAYCGVSFPASWHRNRTAVHAEGFCSMRLPAEGVRESLAHQWAKELIAVGAKGTPNTSRRLAVVFLPRRQKGARYRVLRA